MIEINMKAVIDTSADNVWSVISEFGSIGKYVNAVADCSVDGAGVGAKRTLTLNDGGKLVERLESIDEVNRSLTYSIVSGPLPVDNYVSDMKVNELAPNRSEIIWKSSFVASGVSDEEAKQVIEGIYNMGFEGLKKLFQ